MSLVELCGQILFELFGTHELGSDDIGLRLTDNEILSSGLHHVDRELTELIDFDDPLHLRQQKVRAGESCRV